MTWEQLHEMEQTGLFDVQSHTYWHPNFKHERKQQKPDDYVKFVRTQLVKSKAVLEQRMGHTINTLAWPFGIYDVELMQAASDAGYIAAFTLDAKPVTPQDAAMALARYMVVDATGEKGFARILREADRRN
jgi:peptidoglycan/xylan/chitin deacetylase (PgdA/CDA1 family)